MMKTIDLCDNLSGYLLLIFMGAISVNSRTESVQFKKQINHWKGLTHKNDSFMNQSLLEYKN